MPHTNDGEALHWLFHIYLRNENDLDLAIIYDVIAMAPGVHHQRSGHREKGRSATLRYICSLASILSIFQQVASTCALVERMYGLRGLILIKLTTTK